MARIVVILNRLVIGGAPFDTIQLAGYLSNKHEVYLLVGEKNKDEYDASYLLEAYPSLIVIHLDEVHRSINVFNDWRAFFHIKKVLQKIKPDIVHTNGAKPGLLGRLAAKFIGVKVILHTYHGHVFHSYFNKFISSWIIRMERLLASYSTRIIAISESQKDELANVYKICSAEKITVINLGIDISKFCTDKEEKRKLFRNRYDLADNETAIGIVGRIVPIKGHGFFIDIVEDVLKKTTKPVRFFIVGDGAERHALMNILRRKNIDFVFYPNEQRKAPVTFTSWLLDIDNVMNGLDILALTSLNEGVPIALLEASAAAKPVISTNVGAVSDIIDDTQSGFIINVGDRKGFAEKLNTLIKDENLRLTMGERGFLLVKDNYSSINELEKMENLYNNLLANVQNPLNK